jgi:hypothetical protein
MWRFLHSKNSEPIFKQVIDLEAAWFTHIRATMRLFAKAISCLGWAALVATLGACATDANPVRDAVARAGFGPKITPAPDFVAASRPANLDYVPVGRPASAPSPKGKRADEIKAAEAEMESLRARNESRGVAARRAVGAKAGPASAGPPDQE